MGSCWHSDSDWPKGRGLPFAASHRAAKTRSTAPAHTTAMMATAHQVSAARRRSPWGVSSPSIRRPLSSETAGALAASTRPCPPTRALADARARRWPPASASVPSGTAAGSGNGTLSPVCPDWVALRSLSMSLMRDERRALVNVPALRASAAVRALERRSCACLTGCKDQWRNLSEGVPFVGH